MPHASRSQLVRLGVIYLCCFGGLGALFPLLPLVLHSRGLSSQQIAWVMALSPIATLLAPPLWGLLADILDRRSGLLRLATAGAAASALLFAPRWSLAPAAAAMAVHSFFRAPVASLADAITHGVLGDQRARFARVRIWGSVGFAVCVALVGLLHGSTRPAALAGVTCAAYLLAAAATAGVDERAAVTAPGRVGLRDALAHLGSLSTALFLAATGCYYAGHATYDAFYSLQLRTLGYGDTFVGLAWAIGVVAEIGVMLAGPRLMRHSAKLLLFCAATAALRWSLLSVVARPSALLLLQPLHGITFGLWYLSLVKEVQDRAPDALRAAHQSTAWSAVGLGMVGGYLGGGALFARGGGTLLYRWAGGSAVVALALYWLGRRRWP